MFTRQSGNRFRTLGLWFGALVGVLLAMPSAAQHADDGFQPVFDGIVRDIDVNAFDSKIIAVGNFDSVDGQSRARVVRLNTDGSVDPEFTPAVVTGEVLAAASYYDGRVLIAGHFSAVGGVARIGIARLNADGSLDGGFAPVLGDSPTSDGVPVGLAVHVTREEKILLGGWFGSVDGKTHKRIVRFNRDGSVDDDFNVELNEAARGFTVLRSSQIVIHGSFSVVNGEPRQTIAKLNYDGSLVPGFNPAPDYNVVDVVLQADDKLVVSGYFEHIAGATRHGIARITVDGDIDPAFSPDASLFGPQGAGRLALQRDGRIWATTGLCPGFSTDWRCDSVVRLNPDGSLDDTKRLTTNEVITSLAMQSDGKLLVGGWFTPENGASLAGNYLSRLYADGSEDLTTRTYALATVRSVTTLPDGGLILGGDFDSINMQPRRAMAKLHADGSLDADFKPNLASPTGPGHVNAVSLLPDGRMIVAGAFGMVNGNPTLNLARLHADGNQDHSFVGWVGGNSPHVNALLPLPNGSMLVGGKFDLVNGVARANLARLDADGNLDAAFVDAGVGEVTALARQADGSILVGVTMMPTLYTHLLRLAADGSWDTAWYADTAHVTTLVVQPDGKLLVGGGWDMALPGLPTMQRLNPDGSRDTSFNVNVSDVQTMVLQSDGGIIVGGTFSAINGQPRNNIGRVDRNGVLDPNFDPNAYGAVRALAMQADGKLALGGDFTLLDGQTRYYFGRLSAPDARTQKFYFVPYTVGGSVVNWSGMPASGTDLEAPPLLLARPEGDAEFVAVGRMQRSVDGWTYAGYLPPFNRNVDLRVRAQPRSGQSNGSSGLIESTLRIHVHNESSPDGILRSGFE